MWAFVLSFETGPQLDQAGLELLIFLLYHQFIVRYGWLRQISNIALLFVIVIFNEPKVGMVQNNYKTNHCVWNTEIGILFNLISLQNIEFQSTLELTGT